MWKTQIPWRRPWPSAPAREVRALEFREQGRVRDRSQPRHRSRLRRGLRESACEDRGRQLRGQRRRGEGDVQPHRGLRVPGSGDEVRRFDRARMRKGRRADREGTGFRSENKVVFVTGASRGIGRACAVAFARAHAKTVAVNYAGNDAAAKETCSLIEASGSRAQAMKFDVSIAHECAKAVEQIAKEQGSDRRTRSCS